MKISSSGTSCPFLYNNKRISFSVGNAAAKLYPPLLLTAPNTLGSPCITFLAFFSSIIRPPACRNLFLFSKIHIQFNRTMIGTHDLGMNHMILKIFFQTTGNTKIVNPPPRIVLPCMKTIRPPCISSFQIRI